jgi:hypothetical protein
MKYRESDGEAMATVAAMVVLALCWAAITVILYGQYKKAVIVKGKRVCEECHNRTLHPSPDLTTYKAYRRFHHNKAFKS